MAQPIRLCNPSPPTAAKLSYSQQRLCPSLHIQKADEFSAWRERPGSQNETPAGEEMLRKGSAGLELSSQHQWIHQCPAGALCQSVQGPGRCWRGELAEEPSSPSISVGLQPGSYFLRKITWFCWSSRWHCDIKANEERQASEQGTDKRRGRWIFIIVPFQCKIGGCRNYQRWKIFCGILWEPYVWQFTNHEENGA